MREPRDKVVIAGQGLAAALVLASAQHGPAVANAAAAAHARRTGERPPEAEAAPEFGADNRKARRARAARSRRHG